jgi:hypothetical protein
MNIIGRLIDDGAAMFVIFTLDFMAVQSVVAGTRRNSKSGSVTRTLSGRRKLLIRV